MWGILWFPYRLLAQAGVGGELSALLTYGMAALAGFVVFPRAAREWLTHPWLFFFMGVAAGISNVSYILSVLEGNIVRVVLLFNLAPLWTIPLARWLLDEKLSARGYAVMSIAMLGALVMLWRPDIGMPWPASRADWLGVVAGLFFALCNVMVRKVEGASFPAKSLAVLAGVTLVALPVAVAFTPHTALSSIPSQLPLLSGIALALICMSLVLQYGLSHIAATRAVVIMLFELVVAAAAAWWLADEVSRAQEWIGGALIVVASLLSGYMGQAPPRNNAGVKSAAKSSV